MFSLIPFDLSGGVPEASANEGRTNMSNFLDDVARSLASPLPRRKALKLLGGVLMGSLAATLWPRQAGAQEEEEGLTVTCKPACPATQHCCLVHGKPRCVTGSCCGKHVCELTEACCGNRVCCPRGRQCCGSSAHAICCRENAACVKGRCSVSSS